MTPRYERWFSKEEQDVKDAHDRNLRQLDRIGYVITALILLALLFAVSW